jgi:hypothetical protein
VRKMKAATKFLGFLEKKSMAQEPDAVKEDPDARSVHPCRSGPKQRFVQEKGRRRLRKQSAIWILTLDPQSESASWIKKLEASLGKQVAKLQVEAVFQPRNAEEETPMQEPRDMAKEEEAPTINESGKERHLRVNNLHSA